jgi:hypothetical protein
MAYLDLLAVSIPRYTLAFVTEIRTYLLHPVHKFTSAIWRLAGRLPSRLLQNTAFQFTCRLDFALTSLLLL